MKRLLFPFVLALAAVAPAQDRASAEAFVKEFIGHAEAWRFDAMLERCDPTIIGRQGGGLFTYPDLKEGWGREMERLKGQPLPKYVTPSSIAFDRVDIVGERAMVDFTQTFATERAGQKPGVQKVAAILTWRDGGWKFWRVDVKP